MTGRIEQNFQLDSIRALALGTVFYSHFYSPESNFGHFGVRIFFVLSAFLITGILLEVREKPGYTRSQALRSFYMHRVLRIFPAYYTVILLAVLANIGQARTGLFWQVSFLSNYWYAVHEDWVPWVFAPTWTLSIEAQFYLLWPLVTLSLDRRRLTLCCFLLIASSVIYRLPWMFVEQGSNMQDLLLPASFDALAVGALIAIHRQKLTTIPRYVYGVAAACIVLTTVLDWSEPATSKSEAVVWIFMETLPLLPMALLIHRAAAGMGGPIGNVLGSRPLSGLGRISYGMYLYHFPVLAFALSHSHWIPASWLGPGLERLLVFGVATAGASYVSWIALERPIQRLKRFFPFVGVRPSRQPAW